MSDQPWLHPKVRTKLAEKVCNFMLRHVAEPWYRTMVEGSIRVGMDEMTGRVLNELLDEAGPGARFMPLHEVPTDGTWAIYQSNFPETGGWLQYTERHHLARPENEGSGAMVVVKPWGGPDLDPDDPLNMVEM